MRAAQYVPLGYGLTLDQMRALGLDIWEPRSPPETDPPFAEPRLFVINPQGRVQIAEIPNAPFARADLAGIGNGIKIIRERNYPERGAMSCHTAPPEGKSNEGDNEHVYRCQRLSDRLQVNGRTTCVAPGQWPRGN